MKQINRRGVLLGSLAIPVLSMGRMAWAQSAEVTISHYFTGELGLKAFNEQVAKFTAATGIEMKDSPVGHEDFKTDILVRAAGNSLPDVFSYWAGARVQFIVKSNALHPIDDMWAANNLDAVIAKPVADSATLYNGKRYLVPFNYHYAGMFYNTKVLADAGMTAAADRPGTSSSPCARRSRPRALRPIALGSKNRWPAQFWFDYLLLRTAGPEYRAKLMAGEATYSDPEVAEAMALWKALFDAGYFVENANADDWTDAADKVARGDAAMTLMGTWITGYWNGNGLVPGAGLRLLRVPARQGRRGQCGCRAGGWACDGSHGHRRRCGRKVPGLHGVGRGRSGGMGQCPRRAVGECECRSDELQCGDAESRRDGGRGRGLCLQLRSRHPAARG